MSMKRQGVQLKGFMQPKIQKILECPVCFEIPFSTNIFTCTNGHIICATCKPRVKVCGICRAKITNTRSLCNEEIIANSTFDCENHEFGCKVVSTGDRMLLHSSKCNFRPFKCPISNCMAHLSAPTCIQHLRSLHNTTNMTKAAEGFRDILVFWDDSGTGEIEGPWPSKLFTCSVLNFITQPEMRENRMYFRIFSINPPEDGRYFVKLDFHQNGKLKYSVMVEPVPVTLQNVPGTNKKYIPAIIDESVWSNIKEVRGNRTVLCVHYNVVKV